MSTLVFRIFHCRLISCNLCPIDIKCAEIQVYPFLNLIPKDSLFFTYCPQFVSNILNPLFYYRTTSFRKFSTNRINSFTKLSLGIRVVTKITDTETPDLLWNIITQYLQCIFCLTGNQHSFALCKQRAYYICNCMAFPGTGRSLYKHTVMSLYFFSDF